MVDARTAGARHGRSAGRRCTCAAAALVAALPGAAALGGCGTSGSSDGTPTTATTTTSAPSSTTSTTSTTSASTTVPSTTEPVADVLPEGESVALLRSAGTASAAGTPLTFDVVQFLTGQAAIDAAVARGDAQVDDDGTPYVDNDYYVVNDNPKLRTMVVAPDATITIDGCDGGCPDQIPAPLATAVENQGGFFTLTVRGHGAAARITAIHQKFVP